MGVNRRPPNVAYETASPRSTANLQCRWSTGAHIAASPEIDEFRVAGGPAAPDVSGRRSGGRATAQAVRQDALVSHRESRATEALMRLTSHVKRLVSFGLRVFP